MANAPLPYGDSRKGARTEDWLVGCGEMGKLVRSMDWAKTPLGPIESWPQSLRTTVSLGLASNFPISVAWGPQHVQIYNDGYWPICGGKHPGSMGQDFSECWASPWPVIGEAFERALAGETSYLENQRMFLDRHGYLEETFFTFSFSPIRDESGGVGGLFHPVTETTSKMVGERRTRALRDLAARTAKAQNPEEAFHLAAQTLSEFELDIPFALFYLVDEEGKQARLVSETSSLPIAVAAPIVGLEAPQSSVWRLAAAIRANESLHADNLELQCGPFSCGPYPETPKTAAVIPIKPPGCERPLAVLVAGVSSRLPFNEAYSAFYDLIAATVTSAVANARAYEAERNRAQALAEIDQAKTAFFSNVSHEFRTPLTLILGPLEDELAELQSPLPADRHERLGTAYRNTLRLLKLVNTLLDFSRMEAGRTQACYVAADLAAYTEELASVFRSAIEKAGLTLTVDCPPLPEPIYIDRDMWEKVVLNLLSNAFKHTFEGGIAVALKWQGDHVDLVVSDSGVGIPESELPHLFDRFHRVKGAKSRTHEGTGIGLALVQELIRSHQGAVRAESREGKGSAFTVTLKTGRDHLDPERIGAQRSQVSTATQAAAYVEEAEHWISSKPSIPAAGVASSGLPQARPESGGARSRILWVDDNADMREYVGRLLSGRYDVTAVGDGVTALASARAQRPDLILTDVMMPGLDGFGLLRKLRADDLTRTVPVILLSARAGEESSVEGLEAGADDYLVKPFSARELLARVHTHLELAKLRRAWAMELEAANRELEAFSHSVSHDLRAPLWEIEGFASLLLEKHAEGMTPEALRLLNNVTAGTQRMNDLIERLLKFSQTMHQPLSMRPVNISGLVKEVLEELCPEHVDRRIEVKIGDLPECVGDLPLLRQVFLNLLSNSFKYTGRKEKPVVEVGCQQVEGERVYFVRDNGAGFNMENAERLFGIFQRLHSDDEFEGTGVGLSLVRRIVQRHGGRIWAHSEPDKGATFFFVLPGHPGIARPERQELTSADSPAATVR
jgi:signal transduction histidine kinase